jgi:type I restriction enzyme S subunit
VVTFVDEDFWPLNTALWVKEFKRVSPYYAYFMLGEMGLEQYNGGASVPTLDRKAVHRVPVLIPAPALVQQFDEHVQSVFRQKKTLNQMSTALRTARDLLLPKLMSGEIAV